MSGTLYRQDLDNAQCARPGCAHEDHAVEIMALQQTCHPDAGLEVIYDRRVGNIILSCNRCQALVIEVAVAEGSRA